MKKIFLGIIVLSFISATGASALTISDAVVYDPDLHAAVGFASTSDKLAGSGKELSYINDDAQFMNADNQIFPPDMYYFGKDEVSEVPTNWTFTSDSNGYLYTPANLPSGYYAYSFTIDGPDDFEGVTIDFALGVKQESDHYSAFFFRGVTLGAGGVINGKFNSYNANGNVFDVSHITAFYSISNFSEPPSDNPVPEPSTLLLMGAGIAGFAFYRRKKK